MDSVNEKIENFLTNVIKVKDWKTKSNPSSPAKKIEFLKELVKCHVNAVYFQNIGMAAVESDKRHGPSLEEIIEVGSNGNGGVCIQLNYFFKLILDYLGYDAFAIGANVLTSPLRNNHCCTIVRFDAKELYLVDVACGAPCDEPVPLHKLPYRTIAAGYSYEYRLSDEGIYQRVHFGGSYTIGDFPDTMKEDIRYTFDLEPRPLSTFDSPMQDIFTDSENSIFLRIPFAFRHFLNENAPEEGNYNFILVLGTTVVIAGRNTRQVTKYDSLKEIIPVLVKHFPKLIPSETEKAINVWQQFVKENLNADR